MTAQQIVKTPAHPMDFTECWNVVPGCTEVSAWFSNTLMGEVAQGYVLVPTILTGAHEWTAHLTQLVLVWIAVITMASLALRFGWDRKHAMIGALLLVAIAPFLPMAGTAMPEPLATALALVAMERLAAWKAEQRWGQGSAAAGALGLAGFARPHLVLLLPLAALYLFDSAQPREFFAQFRRRPWLWTPVLAGACLAIAIIVVTRGPNLGINPPAAVSGVQHIWPNLTFYLVFLSFPIPLGACWLANRLQTGRWPRVAIFLALAACFLLLARPWDPVASFLTVAGLGMMGDLLFEQLDKADHAGLILMFWILIPLPVVYYHQLPAKFLLPCMPAVILLCFRLMEGFPVRFTRVAAIALIAAGAGYSLLILRSDAEFARFGRDSMYSLIAPHVAAGQKVWYTGQYWSYWYAPLAGATLTYPGGPQPKPGDLVVYDVFAGRAFLGGYQPLARFPRRTLVDAITHKYRFGRTMGDGISLYSIDARHLMWGFGDSADDRYELWRIN